MLYHTEKEPEIKNQTSVDLNKIKGIDRIVPIGRAFDLTPEWDGVDIISTLSRTIGV